METKEIKELIEILKDSGYQYVDIKHEGTQIVLSKEAKANQTTASVSVPEKNIGLSVESTTVEHKTTEVTLTTANDYHVVKSPIVGTFYAASAPGAPAFVSKGETVKKGDTLCIIEAMKLMNEIESEVDGTVVEVLVSNEDIVEYGQPLFKIATC